MAFDWKNFSLNQQIILGSFGVAILSMFLPWVDMEIITLNGFQQQGYIFLVCFVYPLYCICLLYTSPSPRDSNLSRMPSSA